MSEFNVLHGCYVYGIGQKQRQCHGHGDFSDELAIRKRYTKFPDKHEFPPLFLTEKEAWSWIKRQNHAFDLEPVKLKLILPEEMWLSLFGGYEDAA